MNQRDRTVLVTILVTFAVIVVLIGFLGPQIGFAPGDQYLFVATLDSNLGEIEQSDLLNIGEAEGIICNPDILNPETCDYRFGFQNLYAPFDIEETTGIKSGEAWTISGGHLLVGSNTPIEEVIAATEEEVREKLQNYLDNNVIDQFTTNLVTLDIERPIHAADFWRFDENTIPTQQEVFEAYKMRIRVARELMPNAKLNLYGIIVGSKTGVIGQSLENSMIGYEAASAAGVFDDGDYVKPILFQWHYPNHEDHASLEQFTRTTIELSQSLTKKDGTPLKLAPTLGVRYRIEDPATGELVWITKEDQELQLKIIQEYPSIEILTYWVQSDGIDQLPEYFEEIVAAVPCECFN